jgi:hypothetical protein
MPDNGAKKTERRAFNGFDYFVIAGGAVNVLVICLLLGYWLVAA